MNVTPGDLRGRAVWLYCLTDHKRRVVKVGISANVPRRVASISMQGHEFLRRWCGWSVPNRISFPIVRTWSLGQCSHSDALKVEALAHAELREVAPLSMGEWFQIDPRTAVALIERACRPHFYAEAS